MNTKPIQRPTGLVTRLAAFATAAATLAATGSIAGKGNGKGKGNGNNDGSVGGDVSGWIYTEVELDDDHLGDPNVPNGAVGDGAGPYVYGVDRVEALVGRNFNIQIDLNTHKKKASIRHLHFPAGVTVAVAPEAIPPGCGPILVSQPLEDPSGVTPVLGGPAAADAHLRISGQDHDDTPVGTVRHVGALLTFRDDAGETWHLYFGRRPGGGGSLSSPCASCMFVERLPNTADGKSQWRFWTEDVDPGSDQAHLAYLYRDNRPPHSPTEFVGIVEMPVSGTITSLTDETPPSGAGYVIPEDPPGCPDLPAP